MKKPPSIVKHIHRGTVAATALHIDAQLLGETEARARVLRLWHPGTQVRRAEEGYLVVFPAAVPTDCRIALGLPFTRQGGVLAAMPLTKEQLETLALPHDAVVMFRRGHFVTTPLTTFETVDPADWLDFSNFKTIPTATLGARPKPARVVVEQATFDGRKQFKTVPDAAPEQSDILNELRRRAERGFSPMADESEGEGEGGGSGLKGLLARFARWFDDDEPVRTPSGRAISNPLFSNIQPQEPSWLTKQARNLFSEFLMRSRLARIYGRRQAEYLGKMMRMFEDGDWQEALRHAIPLNGEGSGESGFFFGLPTARTDLKINLSGASGTGGSIGLTGDIFNEMREMYRAAFQRLDAQGRHEEAAFVLAELLRDTTEAVAYLERHGKIREAAMLAEARQLAPSIVIRLWLLVGETKRAVMLARRHKAFGAVVTLLENKEPELSKKLRLLWADSLADAGDYAAAVQVIWPIQEARGIAAEWMRRIIDAGGVAGADMLARYLVEFPNDQEAFQPRAVEILDDEMPETAPERTAIATVLKPHHLARLTPLKRRAARALMRDFGNPRRLTNGDWNIVTKLIEDSQDGDSLTLRADLPPQPAAIPASRMSPLEFTFEANDCGTLPVHDAVHLPNGRTLVALGEAGAKLLSPNGRTMFHFNVPAHRIVIATHGNSALAVANRGDIKRIARLDLIRGTARDWCDAELEAFAESYDGEHWYVASRGDVLMIDPTGPRFDALWRIPDCGTVANLYASSSFLIFDSTPKGGETETFKYAVPACRLLERPRVPKIENPVTASQLFPHGTRLSLTARASVLNAEPGRTFPCVLVHDGDTQKLEIPMPEFHEFGPHPANGFACDAAMFAVRLHGTGETVVTAYDFANYRRLAAIRLQNTTTCSVRFFHGLMTLADDRGRVVVVNPHVGVVARNLRI